MSRPAHYQEYEDMTEVVPGVFYEPGAGVYIVDDLGEVVCWVDSEWEDPLAVTACVNACILAAVKGAAAVRENLWGRNSGARLEALCEETHEKVHGRV